jgi:hypothetical protein
MHCFILLSIYTVMRVLIVLLEAEFVLDQQYLNWTQAERLINLVKIKLEMVLKLLDFQLEKKKF